VTIVLDINKNMSYVARAYVWVITKCEAKMAIKGGNKCLGQKEDL